MKIRCPNPNCGLTYKAKTEHQGKIVTCKQCDTRFVIDFSGSSPVAIPSENEPPSHSSESTRHPTHIGRFEIHDFLGSGAFGSVYRASDPQLQRDVALKLLRQTADVKKDAPRIRRFLQEGRAAARLQHPNIVPVFDAGLDSNSGEYYLAAAYIEGKTLETLINNNPVDTSRAATIVRQLASALEYAHQKGILHRDVKPDNIMVDSEGTPFLMDFGLARIEDAEERMTTDGSLLGTPAFMSPEQFLGKHTELTGASDQYSLGCVLYQLLTGATPFDGPWQSQLHDHLNLQPKPPSLTNPSVTKDLETICLKCLSKDSPERYSSCGQLSEDLERWLEGEPILARPLTPVQRFARWCKKEPVVAGLTASVFFVFALGLTISTWQWSRAETEKQNTFNAKSDLEKSIQTLSKQQAELTESRNRAKRNEKLAKSKTAEAHQANETLQEQSLEITKKNYRLSVALALSKIERSDLNEANRLLDQAPEELREWEWNFGKLLCNPESTRIKIHQKWTSPQNAANENERLLIIAQGTSCLVLRLPELKPVYSWDSPFFVGDIDFNKDGSLVALAKANSNVIVTLNEVSSGRPVREFAHVPKESVIVESGVRFSRDSSNLITRHLKSINLFSLEDSAASSPYDVISEDGTLRGSDFVAGDNKIVVAGNQSIRVINIDDKSTLGRTFTSGMIDSLAVNEIGDTIAIGCLDGSLHFWKWQVSPSGRLLTAHTSGIRCTEFVNNDKVCAGTADGKVIVEGVTSLFGEYQFSAHSGPIDDIAVANDLLATSGRDDYIKIWKGAQSRASCTIRVGRSQDDVYDIAWHPDGDKLATACISGNTQMWSAHSGELVKSWTGGTISTKAVCISPSGQRIFSGGRDHSDTKAGDHRIRYWSTESTDSENELVGHDRWITHIVHHPISNRLYSTGYDNVILEWDLERSDKPTVIKHLRGFSNGLAISPDGTYLAFGEGNAIRIWDLNAKEEIRSIQVHTTTVDDLNFSKDGTLLGSASRDGTARVHELGGRYESKVIGRHRDWCTSVDISPNGKRIVTCGNDGTVRLWNREGTEMLIFRDHSDPLIHCVRFSPDGRQIASAANDGTVRIMNGSEFVPPQELEFEQLRKEVVK